MRRDYYKESGGEIPEGCVLWLPLSEEGDLVERVTGQTLTLTGNGSLTWDSTEEMYRVTNPSMGQYVGGLNIDNLVSQFPNNEFTYLYEAYGLKDGQSGVSYRPFSLNPNNTNTYNVIAPMWNGTANANNWPRRRFKAAWCISSIQRKCYQDGSLYNTYGAYAPYLPSNWDIQGSPNFLIGHANSIGYGTDKSDIRIKNYMLFNRVLTQAEIKLYQGIE